MGDAGGEARSRQGDELVASVVSAGSQAHAALGALVAAPEVLAKVSAVAGLFVEVFRAGGQLLAFGNGGSAAEASHLAAEFVGRCTRERDALPALALGDGGATVTALGNDYGYEQVFARQVRAHGRPGDLAVAFTTSGRSANVLAGLVAARDRGLRTVAFTGAAGADAFASGGSVAVDHVLVVPSRDTGRIQEVHQLWAHLCAEAVETALFDPRTPTGNT